MTVAAPIEELHLELWLRKPQLTGLRPPYPGASITNAEFVRDGRIALVIALTGGGREGWLLDPLAGTLERVGPPGQWPAVAVGPDGRRVAYLRSGARSPSATQAQSGSAASSRLDEAWTAEAQEDAAPRLLMRASDPTETLVDISWSADGQHLLVASRRWLVPAGRSLAAARAH